MTAKSKSLLMFSALAMLPAGLAFAQVQAPPARAVQAAPAAKVQPPRAPVPKVDPLGPQAQPAVPAPPPPPPPPPPLVWTPIDAQQLLGFINSVAAEGLEPLDYDPAGLAAALSAGNPAALSQAASDRFNRLSSDLALGHVRGKDRIDWTVVDNDLDANRQYLLARTALEQHRVVEALRGLLPTHPQYGYLRTALAVTPRTETAKLNRIRLNMDRWRWLPRDLGDRYIIVNVPAYTAALVENGNTISRHHAVAGKLSTPTPQLSALATGVILNPWWEVPKSIESEAAGKKGFVAVKGTDGKIQRWRQPPGPTNALGKLKFVMPNSKLIYLHDTNEKSKFNSAVRAFSHGCIRTEKVVDLATILLTEGGTEWTPEKIQQAIASGKTTPANFPRPLPVFIVYMSSAALVDGTIKDYDDVYDRDGKAIAALLDRGPPGVDRKADSEVAER